MQKLISLLVITLAFGQLMNLCQCQVQIFDAATGFIPTVVVDHGRQPGDSSVDVHLGNVVDLGTDNATGKSRVDLSVLGGLVTVATNKTRLPDGGSSGPVIVTVFGIPVYVGQGIYRPKPSRRPPRLPPTKPEADATGQSKEKLARLEKDLTKRSESQQEREQMVQKMASIMMKLEKQSEIIKKLQSSLAKNSETENKQPTTKLQNISSENEQPTKQTSPMTEPTPKPISFEQVSDMLRTRRDQMVA